MRRRISAAAIGMAIVASAAPATASDWKYTITPYLELSGMNGSTTIGPKTVDVDLNFTQIWDHLDFALMGNFNAQNDVWAFNFDGFYAKLSATGPKRGLLDADITQGIYAGVVARRFSEYAEVYGGLRIWSVASTINFNGPIMTRAAHASKTWVDPIIGLRVTAPLTDTMRAQFMIDAGGFGVGASIDAQIWPTVQFDLDAAKRWQAVVGYRFNYVQYSDGSGDKYFAYDMLINGPTIGVSFNF
jgi:hypothetical protein